MTASKSSSATRSPDPRPSARCCTTPSSPWPARPRRFSASPPRMASPTIIDENGVSATKSLLRTPVSGARLTSGFGMRRHPLLGYSKMHTGVDFGVSSRHADQGRRLGRGRIGRASGRLRNCRQDQAQWQVRDPLRTYEPAGRRASVLAARSIRARPSATWARQAARPARILHYEVRANDRPVNPTRVKLAGARKLSGKELANFKVLKTRVLAMMETAPSATQVAQVQQ